MNGSTHYDVLRVTADAPPEVIRAAYKALSQTWHPDRNPSPEAGEVMQALNTAYAVLSDPSKRADYDRSLRPTSTESAGFSSHSRSANDYGPGAEGAPSGKRGGRAFEVDWDAIVRAQHEQKHRYRVLGRDSLIAISKGIVLLFAVFYISHLVAVSHG